MKASNKELLLASLLFCLIPLLAEGCLRVVGLRFTPVLYVGDQHRGWKLRAGAEGVLDEETRQYVRINSHGFHDQERAYDKPSGTIRIAVLGNSWTEALQVPLERDFSATTEQELNARHCFGNHPVEVLNFGVAGYSTAQELLLLQQEVWRYNPDFVLVAFYSARDVANNIRQLNNAANPDQSPYYVFRGGELQLDKRFQSVSALRPLPMKIAGARTSAEEHVLVLQAVTAMMHWVKTQVAREMVRDRVAVPIGQSVEHAVYRSPVQAQMDDAWRITEGLILEMNAEVKAHGAELRIVTLANRPQVIPDPVKRSDFMHELGVTDLTYADERISSLGRRAGIPVFSLAPELARYASEQHVYLNGFHDGNWGEGHWNETGHRLAGKSIAAEFCGDPKWGKQLAASAPSRDSKTGE